jgi:hypothetical protein
VTEAFLQHYNHERPQEATLLWECPSACRVSHLAHRTRPRHLRVDPDAWLVPLDQKVYLRHVGRDGCVDVDLATYYLGPQMAGWSILFQVEAQSRQFAVWHQDQVVKLLPIKGLVGQEMALDDYLQYILQEALAAPRRASARRGRQSPTAASLGGGSLSSSFTRQLSQALALIGARAGKLLSGCWTKTRGTRNPLLHEQSLCLIAPSSTSHPGFFSLPSQLFPVLPQPFR